MRRSLISHGSAAFHGGVLHITQKDLYIRTTIAMVPFHHLPNRCAAMEGGATVDSNVYSRPVARSLFVREVPEKNAEKRTIA